MAKRSKQYSFHLNLNNPDHLKIYRTLEDLNTDIHKSVSNFVIKAIIQYINGASKSSLTKSGKNEKENLEGYVTRQELAEANLLLKAEVMKEVAQLFGNAAMNTQHDFADSNRYAGDKNIAHIVEVAKMFDLSQEEDEQILDKGIFVGVDGCKGGWITAIISNGELSLKKYSDFSKMVFDTAQFDGMLVDMVIGLPSNIEQYEKRPDGIARKIVKPRTSTVFAVPTRQAVYEFIKDKQKEANLSAIGKGLSEQTIAIIPKMREVDEFLLSNEEYMNVIRESHPEVCFARLNGEVLMTNKSEKEGITDRVQVLSRYLQGVSEEYVRTSAKKLGCKPDDILDAVCLAVTANLDAQGRTEIIPENPSTDEKGLKMQMVIPKV